MEKMNKNKTALLILWIMTAGILVLSPSFLQYPLLLHWDQAIYDWGREHRNVGIVLAMRWVTLLGSTAAVIIFSLVLMAVVYRRGLHWRTLWIAGGAVVLRFGNWGLKHWIHRSRPDSSFDFEPGFGFPSGHAANIAFMALLIFGLFSPRLSRNPKVLWGLFLLLITLAVGASRIVLEVHWFSDVVGGYLFGIWIACGITLFDHSLMKHPS
jgi:membrane-associated phospholipid phosphatase